MINIVLDGNDMKDSETAHKILKEVFEFPDYYGENLDAFWDCITDWYLDGKAIVTWQNFDSSKKYLGGYADKLLEVFQEAAEKYHKFTINVIP